MRYFRRLPLLLRVASLLGLLFPLASIAVLIEALILNLTSLSLSSAPSHSPLDGFRVLAIALNFGMLGGACSFVVNTYKLRFRWPDRRTIPLDSWQSQARAIALLAALPLSALTVALILPLDFPAAFLAMGLTLVAAGVLLAAWVQAAFNAADGRAM